MGTTGKIQEAIEMSERDTRLVTVGISVHLRRRGRVRRHHDRLTTEYRYFAQSPIVTVIRDGTVVGSIDFFYQWISLDSVFAGKLIRVVLQQTAMTCILAENKFPIVS